MNPLRQSNIEDYNYIRKNAALHGSVFKENLSPQDQTTDLQRRGSRDSQRDWRSIQGTPRKKGHGGVDKFTAAEKQNRFTESVSSLAEWTIRLKERGKISLRIKDILSENSQLSQTVHNTSRSSEGGNIMTSFAFSAGGTVANRSKIHDRNPTGRKLAGRGCPGMQDNLFPQREPQCLTSDLQKLCELNTNNKIRLESQRFRNNPADMPCDSNNHNSCQFTDRAKQLVSGMPVPVECLKVVSRDRERSRIKDVSRRVGSNQLKSRGSRLGHERIQCNVNVVLTKPNLIRKDCDNSRVDSSVNNNNRGRVLLSGSNRSKADNSRVSFVSMHNQGEYTEHEGTEWSGSVQFKPDCDRLRCNYMIGEGELPSELARSGSDESEPVHDSTPVQDVIGYEAAETFPLKEDGSPEQWLVEPLQRLVQRLEGESPDRGRPSLKRSSKELWFQTTERTPTQHQRNSTTDTVGQPGNADFYCNRLPNYRDPTPGSSNGVVDRVEPVSERATLTDDSEKEYKNFTDDDVRDSDLCLGDLIDHLAAGSSEVRQRSTEDGGHLGEKQYLNFGRHSPDTLGQIYSWCRLGDSLQRYTVDESLNSCMDYMVGSSHADDYSQRSDADYESNQSGSISSDCTEVNLVIMDTVRHHRRPFDKNRPGSSQPAVRPYQYPQGGSNSTMKEYAGLHSFSSPMHLKRPDPLGSSSDLRELDQLDDADLYRLSEMDEFIHSKTAEGRHSRLTSGNRGKNLGRKEWESRDNREEKQDVEDEDVDIYKPNNNNVYLKENRARTSNPPRSQDRERRVSKKHHETSTNLRDVDSPGVCDDNELSWRVSSRNIPETTVFPGNGVDKHRPSYSPVRLLRKSGSPPYSGDNIAVSRKPAIWHGIVKSPELSPSTFAVDTAVLETKLTYSVGSSMSVLSLQDELYYHLGDETNSAHSTPESKTVSLLSVMHSSPGRSPSATPTTDDPDFTSSPVSWQPRNRIDILPTSEGSTKRSWHPDHSNRQRRIPVLKNSSRALSQNETKQKSANKTDRWAGDTPKPGKSVGEPKRRNAHMKTETDSHGNTHGNAHGNAHANPHANALSLSSSTSPRRAFSILWAFKILDILHTAPPQSHEQLVTKLYWFSRWHRRIRLIKAQREQVNELWEIAVNHHRTLQLEKHLRAWKLAPPSLKRAADELRRRHLLRKGVSGLRWAALSSRTEIEGAVRKCEERYVRRHFKIWYEIFQVHTERAQLLETLVVKHFIARAFLMWKERYSTVQRHSIANLHFKVQLLSQGFHQWKVFVAQRRVKGFRQEMSRVHYDEKAVRKSWRTMRAVFAKTQTAHRHFSSKLLSAVVHTWARCSLIAKAERLQQHSQSLEHRRYGLLRVHFASWKEEMVVAGAKRGLNLVRVRYIWELWFLRLQRKRLYRHIIESQARKATKHHVLTKWKIVTRQQREAGERASVLLRGLYMRIVLGSWRRHVRQVNELRRTMLTFIANRNLQSKRATLIVWTSRLGKQLDKRAARRAWSLRCVRAAVRRWKTGVQHRRRELKLIQFQPVREMHRMKDAFRLWTQEFRLAVRDQKRAVLVQQALLRNQLLRLLLSWRLLVRESKAIAPLVERRSDKQLACSFDAWRAVVLRRKTCVRYQTVRLSRAVDDSFLLWRDLVDARIKIRSVRDSLLISKTTRALLGWREVARRQKTLRRLQRDQRDALLRRAFGGWREMSEELALQQETERGESAQEVLLQSFYFKMWSRNMQQQKDTADSLVSESQLRRSSRTTRAAYRVWKRLLLVQNIVRNAQARRRIALMHRVFLAWHGEMRSTYANIAERFHLAYEVMGTGFPIHDVGSPRSTTTAFNVSLSSSSGGSSSQGLHPGTTADSGYSGNGLPLRLEGLQQIQDDGGKQNFGGFGAREITKRESQRGLRLGSVHREGLTLSSDDDLYPEELPAQLGSPRQKWLQQRDSAKISPAMRPGVFVPHQSGGVQSPTGSRRLSFPRRRASMDQSLLGAPDRRSSVAKRSSAKSSQGPRRISMDQNLLTSPTVLKHLRKLHKKSVTENPFMSSYNDDHGERPSSLSLLHYEQSPEPPNQPAEEEQTRPNMAQTDPSNLSDPQMATRRKGISTPLDLSTLQSPEHQLMPASPLLCDHPRSNSFHQTSPLHSPKNLPPRESNSSLTPISGNLSSTTHPLEIALRVQMEGRSSPSPSSIASRPDEGRPQSPVSPPGPLWSQRRRQAVIAECPSPSSSSLHDGRLSRSRSHSQENPPLSRRSSLLSDCSSLPKSSSSSISGSNYERLTDYGRDVSRTATLSEYTASVASDGVAVLAPFVDQRTYLRSIILHWRLWPASVAFNQWLDYTRCRHELRELVEEAATVFTRSRLQRTLAEWHRRCYVQRAARHHWELKTKAIHLVAWLCHIRDKKRHRRWAATAGTKARTSRLSEAFSCWKTKYKKHKAVLSIVHNWKGYVKQTAHLEGRTTDLKLRITRRSLRECFSTWQLKTWQILEVKAYRNRAVAQRFLLIWSTWHKERSERNQKLHQFKTRRMKLFALHRWQSQLSKLHATRDFHRRAVANHLRAIVRAWHGHASSKRRREAVASRWIVEKRVEALRETWTAWKRHARISQRMRQMYLSKLVARCLQVWLLHTTHQRTLRSASASAERRRNSGLRSDALRAWQRAHWASRVARQRQASSSRGRIREAFSDWREHARLRRAEKFHEKAMTITVFKEWKSRYVHRQTSRSRVLKVANHWRWQTQRSKVLDQSLGSYLADKDAMRCRQALAAWQSAWRRQVKAQDHCRRVVVERCVHSWNMFASRRRRERLLLQQHQVNRCRRHVFVSFERWKNEYTSSRLLEETLASFNQQRAVELLEETIRSWHLVAMEGRAVARDNVAVQRKAWLQWLKSLTANHTASRVVECKQVQAQRIAFKALLDWCRARKSWRVAHRSLVAQRQMTSLRDAFGLWKVETVKMGLAKHHDEQVLQASVFHAWATAVRRTATLRELSQTAQRTCTALRLKSTLQTWVDRLRRARQLERLLEGALADRRQSSLAGSFARWKKATLRRRAIRRREGNLLAKGWSAWRRRARERLDERQFEVDMAELADEHYHARLRKTVLRLWSTEARVGRMRCKHDKRLAKKYAHLWRNGNKMDEMAKQMDAYWTMQRLWVVWKRHLIQSLMSKTMQQYNSRTLREQTFEAWRRHALSSNNGLRKDVLNCRLQVAFRVWRQQVGRQGGASDRSPCSTASNHSWSSSSGASELAGIWVTAQRNGLIVHGD